MFRAEGHSDRVGGVVLQQNGQRGVAIRAESRDPEVSVVVRQGEEFGGRREGGEEDSRARSGETACAADRAQDQVILTHARVTLYIHSAHYALKRTAWRTEGNQEMFRK